MAARISSIGFLGSGKMATAMARGFISAGLVRPEHITASATSDSSPNLQRMKEYGIRVTSSNSEVVKNSSVVWVATKPHAVGSVLREVSPVVRREQLFVSVAAGTTLRSLSKSLPEGAKVVRCMPNTPVVVRNGVTVYSRNGTVGEDDKDVVQHMLASVGLGVEMPEHYMDIITGLTGCGPSYMYVMLDALADGGVYAGIPKEIGLRLIAHTMIGAAKMVLENGKHPQELKDDVCSPAGTSIQAIRTLEKAGFRGIVMDAVHAASKRAMELSKIDNGETVDIFVKR
jgi:pyrroline-5-carboxylate reductase